MPGVLFSRCDLGIGLQSPHRCVFKLPHPLSTDTQLLPDGFVVHAARNTQAAVGASGLTVKRKVGYSGYIPPQRTPIMTTAEKINSRFAELKETNKMNSIRVEATTRFNNAKQALRAWANDELFQADETLISSTMVLEKAFSQRTPVPPVCVGLRPTHVVILRWDANKSDWYIHLPNNLAYYARGTYTNASDYS